MTAKVGYGMATGSLHDTYLSLGSNLSGPWGTPRDCLERAICALEAAGLEIVARSPQYNTPPLGPRQPRFVNAVVRVRGGVPVSRLLRLAKSIERKAGRRQRMIWGPRTLDIDVLMSGKVPYQWPFRRAGSITLPHPELHRRAFVLVPLNDIAPAWVHPRTGLTVRDMLRRRPAAERRGIARF